MNQNLVQLGKQLSAIWNQLGLNQRISIVLSTLLVLGALSALALWSGRADWNLLYGRLDDAESARVIAALNEAGIPHKFGASSGSILVPADKVHSSRMQLASKGIPRADGVGFEIFDKPNFGFSDFVQRANYVRAVQGELARTISQLNEIEAARVMIVIPENRLLIDHKKQPTASVFVRVRGNSPLPSQSINSIRFLVANAVEGLTPNFVTIVDNQGNVLSENTEDDSIVGLTSSQLAARRNLELYLSKKAEGMLEKVLGPGQAVVRVAAEINLDTISRTEENYDPEATALRISTVNDENNDSTTANPNSGVPGISANSAETNASPAAVANTSRLRKKITNNQFEITKTTSSTTQTAGGLKRVSAAVFIAQRFEGAGNDRKPVPRAPDELEKLRRIVRSALGIQADLPGRTDEITLEEMPFNEQVAIELSEKLDIQERRQFWWQLGGTILYPALGFAVLFAFWRAFKKTPIDPIPIGIPLGQLLPNGNGHAHPNGNLNGHAAQNGNAHPQTNGSATPGDPTPPDAKPGVVTVDVLNQLIRENPHNMTHAIRSWLSRGNGETK